MMRNASRARPLAAALVLATVLLSGCVYLRLLELKRQIAAFHRHFSVQTDDGLRIICRQPVLLTDDIRWLGLAPEKTEHRGTAERWNVRWVKQLPAGIREDGTFDIVIELFFVDAKLTRIAIPERYFAVMPKQLLLDLLRSLGGAKVDRDARSVEARLASSGPDLPGITKILGQPTARLTDGADTILRYRYVPVTHQPTSRPAVFDMRLRFNTATGQMLHWEGRTPVGKIGFNFEQKQ